MPCAPRGRGECRAHKCTRSLARKNKNHASLSHHRSTGIARHSRTRMVLTVSFVLSPVIGLSCHRPRRDALSIVARLMPASRHQDHTTSPSASACVRRSQPARPPHPAPNVYDDRETPLMRGGTALAYKDDLPDGQSEIFFTRGLASRANQSGHATTATGPNCRR
jgi:hypothetical protein